METNDEIFTPIKEFEDYVISNKGRIKNINTDRFKKITVCQHNTKNYKMCFVHLSKNKKSHTRLLSRLLAIHFLPNPENLPEVDHIDNNPENNSLANLRWASRRDNCLNMRKQSNRSSKYLNVYFANREQKWISEIRINGKKQRIGSFDTELEASIARDQYIINNNLNEKGFYKLNKDII
jgi:hypothetical protein